MKILRKLASIIDNTNYLLAALAGLLLVFLMLMVAYEVVIRYFLGLSLIWTVEITGYCLLYVTFLAAAWLLGKEGHVTMDLVLNRLNPRTQALLNTITSVIGAIICLIIVWFGVKVTWDNYQLGYVATSELRPPLFLIILIIPIGSFLLSIQFLRRAYGYLVSWRASSGKEPLSMNPEPKP